MRESIRLREVLPMMTDIEIAQSVTPKHILDMARDAGIEKIYRALRKK